MSVKNVLYPGISQASKLLDKLVFITFKARSDIDNGIQKNFINYDVHNCSLAKKEEQSDGQSKNVTP